ncbi:MAG: histidine ammonia-lyase [Planctomycetota bacterium]|nr:MAG: histidine ammonia-lyase [Planctomycetota bacterium]
MVNEDLEIVEFGGNEISVADLVSILDSKKGVRLSQSTTWKNKINSGAEFLEKYWKDEGVIYGVTTGYGDSCTVGISPELIEELPLHLTRFHGCGLGNYFSAAIGRGILATRLSSLSQGFSGVRLELLERLELLINENIIPVIPEEGSVGASGDLTPLSYVAATIVGERQVYHKGEIRETAEVYKELNITPLKLKPKEGLALMNGTSVMTALACQAYSRAEYLVKIASRITAMSVEVLMGNKDHFLPELFAVKKHKGQNQVAAWIYADLHDQKKREEKRLQDRYSIRCAPHVIGVLNDALPWMKEQIETELNSANDNPIILAEEKRILHGGHFYGGHIAFIMDSMKNAIANIADLLDRQMALMMDQNTNNKLPKNLSGAQGERSAINHGLKALQISVSAWTAEALKLTMPASVFSRSTECHNQDKVSMGTIAARDCLRILQLTEQVVAALLISVCQGINIRIRQNDFDKKQLKAGVVDIVDSISDISAFVDEDRPLDKDLRVIIQRLQDQYWSIC